jgi:N-acetylglucosaminyldiphosphoundecaprenol N-acetyl-beta-D-mannosaminyltransferase
MAVSNKKLILGIPVSMDPHEFVLNEIERHIKERGSGRCIAITNTESMYHALRRADHMAFIQEADFSLCDGVGVVAAGFFWGLKINRYNGPILQLDCSDYGQSRGWRHFFYGGKEGVADMMKVKLKAAYPQLKIVGTYCPPFGEVTPEEDEKIVRMLNEAKPDIIWVGLGLIKQEAWIARHLNRLNAPWIVGVGAAFDYHSGMVPWAPKWLRALGLEWVFRLIIQPKLRARRYWWSLIFVIEAALWGMLRPLKKIR